MIKVVTELPAFSKVLKDLRPYVPGMTIGELERMHGLAGNEIVKLASNVNPKAQAR